ncbi:MAG: metallophosphoesterase [Spirochaetia bacterium]|nr:metallophosphoesterase [Spirochaetia bacterium]
MFLLLLLNASCFFDPLGIVGTTDVDERFREGGALASPGDLSVGANSFSLLYLTDIHVFQKRNKNLSRLLPLIASDDKAVFFGGDVVQNGGRDDFLLFRADALALGIPCYYTLGNHDIYSGGWTNFRDLLGKNYYQFRAGPADVFVFDSATGTMGASQKEWLDKALQGSTRELKIVMTHFNLVNPLITELQEYTDPEEIAYLMHLFETTGVDLVLMGHAHQFDDRTIRGVRYLSGQDFVDDGSVKKVTRIEVSSAGLALSFFEVKP